MGSAVEMLTVSLPVAAKMLGVSKPTVYQYAKSPDFPSFKIGGRVLVSVEGLKEWVHRQVEVNKGA